MFNIYICIYNFIIYIVQPVVCIRLLWRSRRVPLYRENWLERYGFYCHNIINSYSIILHAVSLGEVLAAIPLIHALRIQYPKIAIVLTCTTPTGLKLARSQCMRDNNIYCSYFPYDLPGAMRRFIYKINPKLVIVMETELWPNFINTLYQYNIPIVIANARLSLRSFIKYKKCKRFMSLLMKRISLVAAQHKDDGIRFMKLGLKSHQLCIMGNMKFDITITQDILNKVSYLKKYWVKDRPVWIAGSTHSGEEILLLQAHKKLLTMFPNLLMILAPRHPERFNIVKKITNQVGLSYILQSSKVSLLGTTQVIINDTVGQLMLLYGISDIAFVGGSLVNHGGHNPLEPAAYAIPIVMGPNIFNFHDICSKLRESNGLIIVNNMQSLIKTISKLLNDSQFRLDYGNRAMKVLKSNQGSVQRLLCILNHFLYI